MEFKPAELVLHSRFNMNISVWVKSRHFHFHVGTWQPHTKKRTYSNFKSAFLQCLLPLKLWHSQFPVYCHCILLFYFSYSWKQQTAHTTDFSVSFRRELSSCWWNFQIASFKELRKQMESMAITLSAILHKTQTL